MVRFPHRIQFGVTFDLIPSPVHNDYFEAWIRRAKSRRLPILHSNVVLGCAVITVLRQTHAVTTHVSSLQVENANTEALDSPYFPLNICNGRHTQDPSFATDYSGIPAQQ